MRLADGTGALLLVARPEIETQTRDETRVQTRSTPANPAQEPRMAAIVQVCAYCACMYVEGYDRAGNARMHMSNVRIEFGV